MEKITNKQFIDYLRSSLKSSLRKPFNQKASRKMISLKSGVKMGL